jgi:CheY-like chemotaxis protein
MAAKRVLSVGQCFADHGAISRTLEEHFAAEVVPAATTEEVKAELQQRHYDLILVNRIFDVDGSSGLTLIEQLKQDESTRHIPVMLMSNFEDVQGQAVAKGALAGFGKASLGQPLIIRRLQCALGGQSRLSE